MENDDSISEIELGTINTTKKLEIKTPSHGKDIGNLILHPVSCVNNCCRVYHTIYNCICNTVTNEWFWRIAPCAAIGVGVLYAIHKIEAVEAIIVDEFNKDV
jgi:hypothetical protein